jgi:hypothetical protein
VLQDRGGFASLVAFYGYFSTEYNQIRRLFAEKSAPEAFARALATMVAINVIGELISGRGPDEEEEVPEWITRKLLAAPVQLLPIVGWAGEEGAARATSWLWHGETSHRRFSMRASPVMAASERLIRSVGKLVDSEDGETDRQILALLDILGIITGTPVGSSQVQRTVGYATGDDGLGEDISEGDPLGILEGLIYGPREGKGATPLSPFVD